MPLIVLGVGVPVLGLGLSVSSRFAEIGRRAAADVDSSEYVPGHYRRPGAGEQGTRTLLAPLRDPQRWADLTWGVVGLVVPLATWALALVWIAAALAAPRPMPAPAWSGTSTTDPSSASCAWAWTWPGPSGRPPGTRGPRRRSSTGPSPRPARPSMSCAVSRAASPRRCWSTGVWPRRWRRSRCARGVPVAVDADVPRLSEHVEQAAYFVASEALANLDKHSGARAAELGAAVRRRVKAVLTLLSS